VIKNWTRVFTVLKLIDDKGELSLTNLGVMTLLTKIALAPALDWPTASGLMLTLLSYSHKRHVTTKAKSAAVVADARVDELVTKVADLTIMLNARRL
jgi:hypothetical protein